MTLAQRLTRVERVLSGDWCAHWLPAVSVDGEWLAPLGAACACGRPRLHLVVEYVDEASPVA